MITTEHYKGHRWSTDEIKSLIKMWQNGLSIDYIGQQLNSTSVAILKQVQRLRKNGIPLSRRRNGHKDKIINRLWTSGEIEYLLRRRNEKATSEEIGVELNRTPNSVDAMIQKLRKQNVNVPMRGNGVKRLYDIEALKAVSLNYVTN